MKLLYSLIYLIPFIIYVAHSQPIEIEIPTRVEDVGKKYLAADLYSSDTTIAKPVIFIQTPYSKLLYRLVFQFAGKSKTEQLPIDTAVYNYVVMDWRGFFASKTADIGTYDRGKDGYDAIEWMAAQKWCNGKVATYGASALGLIQFQTARYKPPHLVCAVPLVKGFMQNYFQYYYGGDLRKEHLDDLKRLGFTIGDVTKFPYYSAFWIALENANNYPQDIEIPVLMIGGWFDLVPDDVLKDFQSLRENSPESVRNKHKLIMGPWQHTEVGVSKQGVLDFPDAANIPKDATKNFFDYYLLGAKNGWPLSPTIRYFQMGDNEWRTADDWKSVATDQKILYLHPNRALMDEPVPESFAQVKPDTIIFDPKNPTPTYGGCRLPDKAGDTTIGPRDIRDTIEKRKDLLVYSTETITDDIVLSGKLKVLLYVSSNRTDTDFGIRLCDVQPDGKSVIIREGIRRARFRESYSTEKLLIPNQIDSVEIELDNLALTFKKGHQLRIDISCSDYPMFEININNGGALYQPGDTLIAENLIWRDQSYQSRLIIPTQKFTGIKDEGNGEQISATSFQLAISPNPAEDIVIFNLPDNIVQDNVSLTLNCYNLYGSKIISKHYTNGESRINLNVNSLPAGIYVVEIETSDNVKLRTKLIKM